MKKKRFSVEQITAVLQQADQGVPVADLCRKVGISEQSFYRWKKVYGNLQPSEARELKQLRDENTKLKRCSAPKRRRRSGPSHDSMRYNTTWLCPARSNIA